MLKVHKSTTTANALTHVISGNGTTVRCFIFSLTLFFVLDISIERYGGTIGEVVGEILLECNLQASAVASFMDLIEALNPVGNLAMSNILMRRICLTLEKFLADEDTCLKCLKAVFSKPFIDKEKSK